MPSNIGQIGDTNAKNKQARIKYPIYLLAFITPDISAAIMPYAYDKPNKIKVISIVLWSSLISLNGNGLKNSNPRMSVANSTINKITNDRFILTCSITNIFFGLTFVFCVEIYIVFLNYFKSINLLFFHKKTPSWGWGLFFI